MSTLGQRADEMRASGQLGDDTGEVGTIDPRGLLPGRFTQVGLELPDSLTFDEWSAIGSTLRSVEGSIMWWVGDWWAVGEHRYGERAARAVKSEEDGGYTFQTYKDAGWVARKFERSDRSDLLSWSHHRAAARLPREVRQRLMEKAIENGLSLREFKNEIKQFIAAQMLGALPSDDDTCTVADLFHLAQQIRLGERPPFGAIYADPPWQYDNQGTRAATGNHYKSMSVDELRALPVGMLAAEASHLHLWTTNAFLFECPKIFDAWGFEIKTSFVWVKSQIGIGNYWRNAHEIMLTGVRGDAKRFNDHSMPSWFECGRGAHSEKPEQVRALIERASSGPYLELFGRKAVNGWAVWGNQIERSLFTRDVKEVA